MKKIIKILCICLVLLSCFLITACKNFEHKTVYYNPQSNGGKFKFEITVIDVSNNYMTTIFSDSLVATIDIKAITADDVNTDYILELYDFEFYITKPVTIYATYMYTDNSQNNITRLTLEKQSTTRLYLRIDYDSSLSMNDISNFYVLKLWGQRI